MPTLKKCPFCGGDPKLEGTRIEGMRTSYTVRCGDCGASTWPWILSPELAADAWNRRANQCRN